MAGDPNVIGAFINTVPIDGALETTPTLVEACLLACPDDLGVQLLLEYVGFTAVVLPIDAGVAIEVDIEWVDDSNSDTVTNLKADYDMQLATARVNNTVWVGSQILDPGDVINAEFDVATPTTASEGAALIVMGKVLKKSSG